MAITLTRGAQTLDLPESLIWIDELAWVPVSQKADYSIEGALVIDRFVQRAGRPTTLKDGASPAWARLGVLHTLCAWVADSAETVMQLRIDSATHATIFDFSANRAIGGQPVAWWRAGGDGDQYTALKFKFLEV